MKLILTTAAGLVLSTGCGVAEDPGVEFRCGVTAHDLADHVEEGPNVTLDLLFA